MRRAILAVLLLGGTCIGCGTSKWTDTSRTATEQLLISDAMDRAVSELDFRALAGKKVYLDTTPLKTATDFAYLTSTMRQHLLASGCLLKDKLEDADYVVEARAGSSGTDNHSLLFGVPQTSIPAMAINPGTVGPGATIPEIPLAKKMEQRAIVKVALFAYNRTTGRPVWQSGLVITESKAKHLWLFGTGPFQRGTIYEGTNFAGNRLKIPLIDPDRRRNEGEAVSVADEAYFIEPPEETPSATRIAAVPKDTPAKPDNGGQSKPPPAEKGPAAPPGKPDAPPPGPPETKSELPRIPPSSTVPANAPLPAGNQSFFDPFFSSPSPPSGSTGSNPMLIGPPAR